MMVFVVLAGATWLYSNRIETQLLTVIAPEPVRDLVVVASDQKTVTLALDEDTGRPGVWGLEYEGGYAELGDVLSTGDGTVTRQLLSMSGSLLPGTPAAFDRMAFAGDPSSRGVPFEEVLYPGPLGDYRAWLSPGADDTWVIFVHDRGADRREALRLLPTMAALDLPAMVIGYRNDPETQASRGGHVGMGSDEWSDLEAAVDYAVGSGAADVVLVGYGVGGSIIEVFLNESRRAGSVAGVVLDAPLLDAGGEVDRRAEAQKVPGFIVGWSKAIATLRFGVDWGDLAHLSRAGENTAPTLILHGDGDAVFPVALSREFAAAAPLSVELVEVAGAGHGQAWNVDPERYEAAVEGFLQEVAVGRSAAAGEEGD